MLDWPFNNENLNKSLQVECCQLAKKYRNDGKRLHTLTLASCLGILEAVHVCNGFGGLRRLSLAGHHTFRLKAKSHLLLTGTNYSTPAVVLRGGAMTLSRLFLPYVRASVTDPTYMAVGPLTRRPATPSAGDHVSGEAAALLMFRKNSQPLICQYSVDGPDNRLY